MADSIEQNSTSAQPTSAQAAVSEQVEYRLHSPQLPLAVYREVAAHLRQIEGVNTGLLPQTAKEFDYLQSQVGGVWIRYNADAAEQCQPQVEAILTYYGDRYGQWETLSK
ncbi:hypothetical protein [Leptolyngbya iicbica]|uniref:hypothetical protein n=1 Tax=Leptolyngbya iicbica TaxID=3161580 RepID=UPI0005C687DE|nr:hypothetical protein [Leptolyngbya sp. LK]